jgi:Na+/melibiose symporter-like transporter
VASVIALMFYKLDAKTHAQIVRAIEARRLAEPAAAAGMEI